MTDEPQPGEMVMVGVSESSQCAHCWSMGAGRWMTWALVLAKTPDGTRIRCAGCDDEREWTLDESRDRLQWFVQALEARFPVQGEYDTAWTPSGHPFLEIVSGGRFENTLGDAPAVPVVCLTPKAAVHTFMDAVERYVVHGQDHGELYWRARPVVEVREHEGLRCDTYLVYGRLVILPEGVEG